MNNSVVSDFSSVTLQTKTQLKQTVLTVADCNHDGIETLLSKYQLILQLINNNTSIPGSYWGDSEAGLIKNTVYVRKDTPIHSLFHETCHYICMDEDRRKNLNTDAKSSYDEENAVCYLQILLANELVDMTSKRMMQDMDTWGYSFRLGSTQAWFENDAEDAFAWLQNKNLLDSNNLPNYSLRRI